MASGDKNYDIAKQSTLTTSVGTESEVVNTSLFGKINSIINTLTTHVANWTSARAAKIDTIATDAARLTSTRAGYIDRLANSTYGLSAIKTAVDNMGGFSSTGKGTTIYSNTTQQSVGTWAYGSGHKCHAKFIAPVDGWYTLTFTTGSSNNSTRTVNAEVFTNTLPSMVALTINGYTGAGLSLEGHNWSLYNGTTVLNTLTYEDGTTTYSKYSSNGVEGLLVNDCYIYRDIGSLTGASKTGTFYFYLYKGAPTLINFNVGTSGSDTGYVASYSIAYGNS